MFLRGVSVRMFIYERLRRRYVCTYIEDRVGSNASLFPVFLPWKIFPLEICWSLGIFLLSLSLSFSFPLSEEGQSGRER